MAEEGAGEGVRPSCPVVILRCARCQKQLLTIDWHVGADAEPIEFRRCRKCAIPTMMLFHPDADRVPTVAAIDAEDVRRAASTPDAVRQGKAWIDVPPDPNHRLPAISS